MQDRKPNGHSGYWLKIDHAVLDYYGRIIGPYGVAAYAALARFADFNTRTCYPSYETLSEMLQMSRRHVIRVIHRLAEVGLISIKKPPRGRGLRRGSNIYLLNPVPDQPPLSTISVDMFPRLVTDSHQPSDSQSP